MEKYTKVAKTPVEAIDEIIRALINARTAKEFNMITEMTYDKIRIILLDNLYLWIGMPIEDKK